MIKQWEYKVALIFKDLMITKNEKNATIVLENRLNELGNEGWELEDCRFTNIGGLMIFKREKPFSSTS